MNKPRALLLGFVWAGTALFQAGAEDVTIYRPLDPTPAPAPAAAVPVSQTGEAALAKTYTVQKGDTLWKIARTQKVSIDGLKSANKLGTDAIHVGQVLKLPSTGAAIPAPQPEIRRAEPVAGPSAAASSAAPAVAAAAPAATPFHFSAPLASDAPAPVSAPASSPTVPAPAVAADGLSLSLAFQRDLQQKFMAETKSIAQQGVRYDGNWVPPGESEKWDMDCSNTSRWLYKKVAGIDLSRCASDQYYDLQQKDRVWDAPRDAKGEVDSAALFAKLQVGDLLFWENTYKPRRDPAVTHVMVFLGKNTKGQWLMAGSQCGGGFCNVSGSGPDVYVFDPQRAVGGYYRGFFTHVRGSFKGYGRPILDKLQGGRMVAAAQ